MADNTDTAQAYFDGFANNDHEAILALLTDDVIWDIHGHRHLRGKTEFDSEIEGDGFQGSPTLTVERVIDADDTVVMPHLGELEKTDGTLFRFAAVDILTFQGDLISRVESYVVPLPD